MDGDGKMAPLWFDGDCFPKLMIADDYVCDSEEFEDNYKDDDIVMNELDYSVWMIRIVITL